MSRFIRPETATLTLGNGDTLTVRRRLTAGEARARYTRMYVARDDGEGLRVDPMQVGLSTILAYLIEWSLTDDDGRPVAIRALPLAELAAVVDNLEPESFSEIREAIEAHEAAMLRERIEAQKKRDTESVLLAT